MSEAIAAEVATRHALRVVDGYVSLTAAEKRLISAEMQVRSVAKKQVLLATGAVADHLFFIHTGVVRRFHLDAEREINTYFTGPGGFVTAYSSFIMRQPSLEALETVTDGIVVTISAEAMALFYDRIPVWQQMGRIFAEQNFLCMAERVLALHSKSVADRYEAYLAQTDPQIVAAVPLYQVASYLATTPESLSRIRQQAPTP